MLWLASKKYNPYRAKFIAVEGVPFWGAIECGDNPFLLARLVDDFTVERSDVVGEEKATWRERPHPRRRFL